MVKSLSSLVFAWGVIRVRSFDSVLFNFRFLIWSSLELRHTEPWHGSNWKLHIFNLFEMFQWYIIHSLIYKALQIYFLSFSTLIIHHLKSVSKQNTKHLRFPGSQLWDYILALGIRNIWGTLLLFFLETKKTQENNQQNNW